MSNTTATKEYSNISDFWAKSSHPRKLPNGPSFTSAGLTSSAQGSESKALRPAETKVFSKTFASGKSAEHRFQELMAKRVTPVVENPARAGELAALRKWDFRELYSGRTWEVKSDQYANDRLCFEHKCVLGSEADMWAQEFWYEGNFFALPRSSLIELLLTNERNIRAGRAHYYRQPSGQFQVMCTYVPIQEFIKLPTCKRLV
jgi:hypothetical protein